MAPKNKPESKTRPEIKKDHFEALLENMNDNIKLVAEGQTAFREEVNQRFDRSDQRFAEFQKETRANFKTLFEFRDETRANFKKVFNFRDETQANFKTVFDYLSRIDNELQDIKKELKLLDQTKVDKHEFNDLAQRVARLERKLEECKDSLEAKK
jgi:uncharacterized phage infection (PIP) family protein YhgE